ncbi:Beta-mannosyltransferase 1 [[Candida] zeylanoides]
MIYMKKHTRLYAGAMLLVVALGGLMWLNRAAEMPPQRGGGSHIEHADAAVEQLFYPNEDNVPTAGGSKDAAPPVAAPPPRPPPYSTSLMATDHTIVFKTFSDPLPYLAADRQEDDPALKEDVMCPKLEFKSSVEVSKPKYLDVPLAAIEKCIAKIPDLQHLVDRAYKHFDSKLPKESQWHRFGGSSVWIAELGLNFMVSRVYYSPSGVANKGYLSFFYVQAFDQEWQEFPHGTVVEVPYQQDTVRKEVQSDGSVKEKVVKSTLQHRSFEFPSILPIPFDRELQSEGDWYYGPEDPRIILRKHAMGFHEPLIVFNMKSLQLLQRVIHIYMPFSTHLRYLKRRDEPFKRVEKNWTPFVPYESTRYMEFIRTLDPMEVVRCEIDSGQCDVVQAPPGDSTTAGPLRGGSQLIEVPHIPALGGKTSAKRPPANRRVFVGFARAHLNKCGCGESMYRPNLMVLIDDYDPATETHHYKVTHVSEYVDFNVEIKTWDIPTVNDKGELNPPNDEICVGRSVLIPNSISYWTIESIVKRGTVYKFADFDKLAQSDGSADDKVEFNDYLALTLSSADTDVSVVQIKGLLNYLLQLPSLWDTSNVVKDMAELGWKGHDLNQKCAVVESRKYCELYEERVTGKTAEQRENEKKEKERVRKEKEEKERKEKEEKERKEKEEKERKEKEEKERKEKEAQKDKKDRRNVFISN